MEKVNNDWTDDNNNRWDCNIYTELEAEALSKILVNCSDCSDCKTSPQIYRTALIGSRNEVTIFYLNEGIIQVVCGCWKSNLEEFEKRVKDVYEEGNEHRITYLKEIERVKVLFAESQTEERSKE